MAQNPAPSLLDPGQIIKRAFDEANDKIRVDATVQASIGSVTIEDSNGNELDVNPDGSLNVAITGGSLQIELDAADGDNVAISDGTNTVAVNSDGSLNVRDGLGLFTLPYDAITVDYPSTTQEVFRSRVGGVSGTVVQTVTINYTDTTKNFILNAARL